MPPTTAPSRASRRLGGFRFRTVSLGEPPVSFKAEGGSRNHLLHGSAALGALAGRWIGEFLAKLELVIAILTLILINRHFYIPPFCAVLHNLVCYYIQYKNYASCLSIYAYCHLQNTFTADVFRPGCEPDKPEIGIRHATFPMYRLQKYNFAAIEQVKINDTIHEYITILTIETPRYSLTLREKGA
jgi:hypothetical protein